MTSAPARFSGSLAFGYSHANRLTDLVEGNSEVTFQWGAGEPLSQIQGSNTYWLRAGQPRRPEDTAAALR